MFLGWPPNRFWVDLRSSVDVRWNFDRCSIDALWHVRSTIVLRFGDFDVFYDYVDEFGDIFVCFDSKFAWSLLVLMLYIEAINEAENACGPHIYPGNKRSLFDPKRGSELARNALPILFSDFIFYSILFYSILLCLLLSLVLLLLSLVSAGGL